MTTQTFKFMTGPGNNSGLVKKTVKKRGVWEEINDDNWNSFLMCDFIWKPINLSIRQYAILDDFLKYQTNARIILNHFENIRNLCTKPGLIRCLKHYYSHIETAVYANYNVFDTMPTSYLLTAGVQDQEYIGMIERYKEIESSNFNKERMPQKHCQANIWLIKPADMNQGRGIEIFKSLKEMITFLSQKPPNTLWVAQKYIEKPLLYYQRKFDLRIWVLFTWKGEAFMYKEGYMRTSSDNYDLSSSKNYVHLTNNCLQKFGENYGKFETGNTLSLQTLQEYINQLHPDLNIDIGSCIITRIKDIILDTYLASKKSINPNKRKYCFELLGYDFMVDEDIRTWLIEVNTNPYLGIPNEFIKGLLPKMLDDLFSITLDTYFPPKSETVPDSNNGFELLYYSEVTNKNKDLTRHVRTPFSKSAYPVPAFAQASNKTKDADVSGKGKELGDIPFDKEIPPNLLANKEKEQKQEQNIYTTIKIILETYPYSDFDPFYNPVARLLSKLMNWELLSEPEIEVACQALKLVTETRLYAIVAENNYSQSLLKIIDSQNFPLKIQTAAIDLFIRIFKNPNLKKKLLGDKLINTFLKIALSSCDEKIISDFDKQLRMKAVNALIAFVGEFSRKIYVPGETRNNEKIRQYFSEKGGLVALFMIKNNALEQDLRKTSEQYIQDYLNFTDWEYQITILKKLRSGSEKENSEKSAYIPPVDDKKISVISPTMVSTSDKFRFPTRKPPLKTDSQPKNPSAKIMASQSEVKLENPVYSQIPDMDALIREINEFVTGLRAKQKEFKNESIPTDVENKLEETAKERKKNVKSSGENRTGASYLVFKKKENLKLKNPQEESIIESLKALNKEIPKSISSKAISSMSNEGYDSENESKNFRKKNNYEEFYLPVIDEDATRGVKLQRTERKRYWPQSKSPILRKKSINEEEQINTSFKLNMISRQQAAMDTQIQFKKRRKKRDDSITKTTLEKFPALGKNPSDK